MKEEYYGCFSDGKCIYYGQSVYNTNGFIKGTKSRLKTLIKSHGELVAKWTVRFKTKKHIK